MPTGSAEVEDTEPFFDPVRGEPDEGSEFPWLHGEDR
jgi:hypothetical protein